MKIAELDQYQLTEQELNDLLLDEGWRDWVAGAAMGAAALGANAEVVTVMPGDTVQSIARTMGTTPDAIAKANKLDKKFTIRPNQELKIPGVHKTDNTKKEPAKKGKSMGSHEAFLTKEARKAGITNGTEIAALLAQASHETHNFKSLVEYGGSLDFRKYDPRFNPDKAKKLGNTKPGDGARYKGRGYLQITGRYNYRRAGEALGLPLEQHPELLEKPEVAAKATIWFWKHRVQPNVDNFNDVAAVTKPINPLLNGLEDRKEAFADFKKIVLAML